MSAIIFTYTQISYTAKKAEIKLKISRLAHENSQAQTHIYFDWSGCYRVHNPKLGNLYDLPIDAESASIKSYIIVDDGAQGPIGEKILTGDLSSEEKGGVNSMRRQASAYLSLVEEMMSGRDCDCNTLIPAFSALRACFNAGWKPKSLPKVLICSWLVNAWILPFREHYRKL